MEITIERRAPHRHVVRFHGELRNDDGPQMAEHVHPLLADRGSGVVVDLSGVGMLDSGGLSQLISLNTHARMCGARVVLAAPAPFLAGVLQVTQLDQWFDMAGDVAAAEKRLDEVAAGE